MNELDESPQKLSSRTTPTWEMELLISGATVFALMQVPVLVDRVFFGVYNTGLPELAGLVIAVWLYVKFALYMLIATFVSHLCLRGYWVALAGLASVYPDGIRWEKLHKRMGPIYTAHSRAAVGDIRDAIERADNRATRVFGIGFGLALSMLMPILLVIALMVFSRLLLLAGFEDRSNIWIMLGAFLLVVLPWGGVVLWDLVRGPRVIAGSREERTLGATIRFYTALGFSRASNPLMQLFSSNEGGTRSGVLIFVTMMAAFALIFWQAVGDRFGLGLGDYRGLPADGSTATAVVMPAMYASQRSTEPMLAPPPHIPDPVVRGDYLRLFIPYYPQRHVPVLRKLCPEALARRPPRDSDAGIAANEAADRARLACLQAVHALAIDGVPVTVPFDAAEDPQSGQRGLLAMIPVRDLAPGRHELTVMPAPHEAELEDAEDAAANPARRPYRIPFWR